LKAAHKQQFDELSEEQTKQAVEKDVEKTPLQKAKSEVRQKNLEEYLHSVKIWDVNSSKSKNLDRTIAEMLVMDDLPFSHVEDLGFMRLMTEVCPQYKLKQRNFYSSMICNKMYDSAFSKVKTIVGESILNCNIAFTTDAV